GVFLAVRAWRNRGLRVLVFPEGVVRVQGNRAVAFFWDEVETVLQKKNLHTWTQLLEGKLIYTVTRTSGAQLRFDEAPPNLPLLGGILQRETLKHLVPRALDALRAGETLTFGPLRVTHEGVSRGPETVPWQRLREVKLGGDRLTVTKAGGWMPWH